MTSTRRHIAAAGIGIFFIVGAILFFVFKKPIAAPVSSSFPSLLPDLVFSTIDGSTISVSSLRGRSVVLDLWASWCQLCDRHISQFGVLQKKFGDKILIIEVNRGESLEVVKKYIEQNGASSYSGLLFALDANDLLYQEIKGFSMPETIFLDKEGKIVDHTRGLMGLIEIERRMQDAFAL